MDRDPDKKSRDQDIDRDKVTDSRDHAIQKRESEKKSIAKKDREILARIDRR